MEVSRSLLHVVLFAGFIGSGHETVFHAENGPFLNYSSMVIGSAETTSRMDCSYQCVKLSSCCAAIYTSISTTMKCDFLNGDVSTLSLSGGAVAQPEVTVLRKDAMADKSNDCCEEMPTRTIMYSAWGPVNIELPDSGPILSVQMAFPKGFADTDLRVIFTADLACKSGCCRFYLTYNGQECTDPASSEMVVHNVEANRTIRYTGYMEGICRGMPKGTVIVMLNTGTCPGLATGDISIGLVGSTRMMIEEFRLGTVGKQSLCSSLTNFNVQQYVFSGMTEQDTGIIYTLNYTKRAPETGLKLTFVGTTRILGSAVQTSSRYTFLINGAACSSPGTIGGLLNRVGYTGMDHRYTSSFEGICLDISAGPIRIDVSLASFGGYTGGDMQTGYVVPTRVIVEEVRMSIPSINQLVTPSFNLLQYSVGMGSFLSNGSFYAINYTKTSHLSSLRVSWSGDKRINGGSSGAFCSRWYFTFNRVECTSPGPIDSILLYSNLAGWDPHRMSRNFGICRGIPAGIVSVDYNIGPCSGVTVSNAFTADQAFLNIEEVIEHI